MEYLKIWVSFREVIGPLGDAEKGRLFDAMLRYAEDGEEPAFTGNERFIWPVARQSIDRAAQKAEKLRQNGMNGGRPRNQNDPEETKGNQTKPKETKGNQTEPKESSPFDNDNNNDKENVKETLKKEGGRGAAHRFSPPTPEEVAEYVKERGSGVDPERFVDYYTSKGWKVGSQPMKDWRAAVRTWEKRDGRTEAPAKAPRAVSAQQYDQRHYTEADLEHLTADPIIRALEAAGA